MVGHEAPQSSEDQPEERSAEESADGEQHLRGHRQGASRLVVDALEAGHDVDQDDHDDQGQGDREQGRIGEGALDLAFQLGTGLDHRGQSHEHGIQRAAQLSGLHQVDEERVEDARVPRQRLAQAAAAE
ncbi:hypothetical protein D3C72_1755330 [compost metagenome]